MSAFFGMAVALIGIGSACAQPFSKVIVFGDSNVDAGYYKQLSSPGGGVTYNSYWASAVAHGAGAPATNPDPVKSQMLAAYFGLKADPSNTPGGTNYATSGAKDSTVNTPQTGGFQAAVATVTQMSNYLSANGGTADPNALYLIYSGDNDVNYAVGEQGQGPYPADPTAYVAQAATDLANGVINLKNLGARKILIAGLWNSFGTTQKRSLRATHNTTLRNALNAASVPYIWADGDSVRQAINAHPSNFGFTSVNTTTVGCTIPSGVTTAWSLLCSSDPAAPSTYTNPNAPSIYLFADDGHLGTAGHRYFAAYFRSLIIPWTVRHDFYGAGKSSILWRNGGTGDTVVSNVNGAAILSTDFITKLGAPWTLVGTGDFYSDGKTSILWQNKSTNDYVLSRMNGSAIVSSTYVATVPSSFSVVGIGDFDGDGKPDLLWRDSSNGNVMVSLMDGATIKSTTFVANLPTIWAVQGVADVNGDGKADILWRNTSTGDVVISQMNGATILSSVYVATLPTSWQVAGFADFDGDRNADILWRDSSNGNLVLSTLAGPNITASTFVANVPRTWNVAITGDFNGDGKTDILWRDGNGTAVVSLMNGASITLSTAVANVPTIWLVQSANAN